MDLTQQEQEQWVTDNAGIKLTTGTLSENEFVVPTGLMRLMGGQIQFECKYTNDVGTVTTEWAYVCNGFDIDPYGGKWEWYSQKHAVDNAVSGILHGLNDTLDEIEQSIELSEPKKCTCELNSLMRNGCKCGGV